MSRDFDIEWASYKEVREVYLGKQIDWSTNTFVIRRTVKEDNHGLYIKVKNQKCYIKLKEE